MYLVGLPRRNQELEQQLEAQKSKIGHAQKEWGETHDQMQQYRDKMAELSALHEKASAAAHDQVQAAKSQVDSCKSSTGLLLCVLLGVAISFLLGRRRTDRLICRRSKN